MGFMECDNGTLVAQIGMRTILAVSGGRIIRRATGVSLPVRYGYVVTVDLAGNDTYTCRRVFARGGKSWVKREWTDVHCEDVGEVAYIASCYLDD